MKYRIVEYATREQAQHAVNTLSNQNLMGRLVYVREVIFYLLSGARQHQTDPALSFDYRTAKLSLVSPALLAVVTSEALVEADSEASAAAAAEAAVDAKSTSLTFVPSQS